MIFYSGLFQEYHPFDKLFPKWDFEVADVDTDMRRDSVLCIWGGADIHPSLYSRPNMGSHVGKTPTTRDIYEWRLMQQAVDKGIPIVGICRGAQMGCALAGGILVQDVSGHGRDHFIKTDDGREMLTSSLHHQMMYPWKVDYDLIAYAHPARSVGHYSGLMGNDEDDVGWCEPEIVWFPDIRCLAIQGHPEFMNEREVFNLYIKELVEKYL